MKGALTALVFLVLSGTQVSHAADSYFRLPRIQVTAETADHVPIPNMRFSYDLYGRYWVKFSGKHFAADTVSHGQSIQTNETGRAEIEETMTKDYRVLDQNLAPFDHWLTLGGVWRLVPFEYESPLTPKTTLECQSLRKEHGLSFRFNTIWNCGAPPPPGFQTGSLVGDGVWLGVETLERASRQGVVCRIGLTEREFGFQTEEEIKVCIKEVREYEHKFKMSYAGKQNHYHGKPWSVCPGCN